MIRGALDEALQGAVAPPVILPNPAAARVAGLLLERYGDGDRPLKSPEELEALLERLRAVNFTWSAVSATDRADIVWVFWQGADPPAAHTAFRENFLRWIEKPWRRVQARRLASSWAAAQDRESASVAAVGAWLAARATRLGDPWAILAETFDIFAPERGPENLARGFFAGTESAAAFWPRLRLPARTAVGGLVLASLRAAAALVQSRLAREPALAERLIDFVTEAGGAHKDATPLFLAVRAELAAALLLPWREAAPPAAVKEQIIGFLLRHWGDPRVKRSAWDGVAPAAIKVLRGWLNREAITAFCRLASRARKDQARRWQAREKFWLAAADRLDDAWLILGTQHTALLDYGERGFGRLVGCGGEHCALLLRLAGITIVESSDSAHERIWLAGNEQAPPRYVGSTRSYSAATLTAGADFSSSYAARDGSAWQKHLSDFLARHTGIALASR